MSLWVRRKSEPRGKSEVFDELPWFLPEVMPTLERHGHLVVTDTVRSQLLAL
jgi:hypothetical protein